MSFAEDRMRREANSRTTNHYPLRRITHYVEAVPVPDEYQHWYPEVTRKAREVLECGHPGKLMLAYCLPILVSANRGTKARRCWWCAHSLQPWARRRA